MGTADAHLTPAVLLEGIAVVAEAAALAVLPLRVVQALEAPPRLLVAGVRVGRVDVVVTVARPARPSDIGGVAKEARGAVLASGACRTIKPGAIPSARRHEASSSHIPAQRASQAVLRTLVTQLRVPMRGVESQASVRNTAAAWLRGHRGARMPVGVPAQGLLASHCTGTQQMRS